MAELAHSRATLRIVGDDLLPDEITALLGAEPTTATTRGQVNELGRGPRVWRTGLWRLEAPDAEPANPDGQIAEILDELTPDLDVWRALAARFRVEIFCGWFMAGSNEGVSLAPDTLRALGERGIRLDIDLYGGSDDDDDDADADGIGNGEAD